MKKRLLPVEMDYLRHRSGVSRLEHIYNEVIRQRMKAKQNVLFRIYPGFDI